MISTKHIAILGASGRTGHYLVQQLVQQGFFVRCLVRTPEKMTIQHPSLEIIKGDALDPCAVDELIKGCTAVINTIGQRKGEPMVSAASTRIVLAAMKQHDVTRYIALTGVSIDVPGDHKSFSTRFSSSLMRWLFRDIVVDKQRAYQLLAESPVNWTLVRVPRIEYTDKQYTLVVNIQDCLGTKISTTDLSVFLVEQLWRADYKQQSPFVSSK